MKKLLLTLGFVFIVSLGLNSIELAEDPDDPGVGSSSYEEAYDPDDPGVGSSSVDV